MLLSQLTLHKSRRFFEGLLQLNGTHYTNVNDLEITTLENAVYMNYKNDISFVFDFELALYEHQSTVNPNMPLRDLIYVTKVLQGIIRNENLYSSTLIKLPTPRFVVFYNGTDKQPHKQVLRLSDAYEKPLEEPELELTVTIYNINIGYNPELLEACRLLKEYVQYAELVREFAKNLPLPEAVEQAVDYSIKNDILADFLEKNRAEAIEMSIFEYDEEKHLKSEREFGYLKGHEAGIKAGEIRLAKLMQLMIDNGRSEELQQVLADSEYREQLYEEYQL